ncbi:Ig-like domain-containing protein [Pontibacillus sp. ALD_SL1]|uniref:Ig-like domain-containing protein n=1 Tax=Pontibacillus sp. ALD_SL1 TaxID=2777185 RepID=UPI001A95AF1C|nr:Ig-like domain-containing protein [Pontibacillus sp. ALD_SL1]QSS99731.1 Ig-like domain-containing protein [Pontibacillus sp. ALD_SL1]
MHKKQASWFYRIIAFVFLLVTVLPSTTSSAAEPQDMSGISTGPVVEVDKEEYTAGETVSITGIVYNEGNPQRNAVVALRVLQDGKTKRVDQMVTNKEGHYQSSYVVSEDDKEGTYSIEVNAIGQKGTTTFTVLPSKEDDNGEGGDDDGDEGGGDDNDHGGSTTPNKVTSEVISKDDKKQVNLELDGAGDIYYTTNTSLVEYLKNGNQESYQFAEDQNQLQKWEKYTEPFEIEKDETVFAVAMHQNETGPITKAASPAVKKWESMTDIPRDKQFTIEFNESLQSSTVNEDTVYVTKENGSKVTIDVALSEDGKTIVVDSKYGYYQGQTYTLHISQHIKAENGYFLKQSVEMEFSR